MASKGIVRSSMRARRRALPDDLQRAAAARLCSQLTRHTVFTNSKRIAFYHPNDGEIDPRPTLRYAWSLSKTCYLPVLCRTRTRRVLFAEIQPDTRLRKNHYGILEPVVKVRDWLNARELDLVLIPLVAFDKQGNRIGMGGGYYDRSLAYLETRKHWHQPHIIGVAHHFQLVDRVETDQWDVPLDGIVTDMHYYPVP
ncbi:MAG: 5-formyltetrahydrofolate cyclo-ligase [Gammaproteobacteria bacterium]|nr:5-formyltetrahydrofolate cyclo-ligase [Gammaproteobacteria bacterium]